MHFSRSNDLMSQVLGPVTVLAVLCIILKQSFAFFPLLCWGIKVNGKLNMGELGLRRQEALSSPPDVSKSP